ncbi:MAG TPA: iron ABC transporter permease [Candidatus Ratteibacteria bacterium]|nr:iron ABC transporter permease [bacterium]HRS05599.1 iron ABC transporter permease [Candidatus Ratteibacteria bacterium]HRV03722.1 iron ABC transporter permease [Candidatus Ratteibacteria bacterium]
MKKISIFSLLIFSVLAIIAGISLGTENFSPLKIYKIITEPQTYPFEKTIFFQLRLPRVWCGFLVGSGLSVAGLILQSVLKNPLAESYTIGISGGASLGIAIGIISGEMLTIPVFAFIGSIFSIFLLLIAGSIKKMSSGTLLLFGIMLNFIFSSFSLLAITLLQKEKFMEAVIWFMGNLGSYYPAILNSAPFFLLPAYFFTWLFWKELNIFSLGEEKAATLGINPDKRRYLWLGIAGLITGYCVSLAGLVGFVGLVIPHAVRTCVGADHKKTIPASILAGGAFLVIADTLARTIVQPVEIPVGVISGFFGGIFFVLILMKTSGKQKW